MAGVVVGDLPRPERPPLRKYPRIPHLEGSVAGVGDVLPMIPLPELAGRAVVITEKLDGANAGISLAPDGTLLLQSRGHYLSGGPRERHFAPFKQWAQTLAGRFRDVLGDRYVVYGEWLYARHTIFYDRLSHYFLAFDVLDRATDAFLDTPGRTNLLSELPIARVPVLYRGRMLERRRLEALLDRSSFISGDRDVRRARLSALALARGHDPMRVLAETDPSSLMEGLVIRVERDGVVQARRKFVRRGFLAAVERAGEHWLDRPIVPNQLAPGVDPFALAPGGVTDD